MSRDHGAASKADWESAYVSARPWIPVAVALAVAGVLVFVVSQTVGGNRRAGEPAAANDARAASDVPGYESMQELVADSPVVVLGRINEVHREDATCPGVPDPACVPWYVSVDIDEQLAGPPMRQLRILYYGIDEEPQLHWGRVGDRAVQFLTGETREAYHRPQATFTIKTDGLLDPWGLHPRYADVLRDQPWAEVRRHVEGEISRSAAANHASPPAVPSAGPSSAAPPAKVHLTRCRDIPRNEPPQDHGVDNSHNPETNLIDIWYTVEGENRHHTLDYLHDSTCAQHPLLRRLITHIVETAAESYPADAPPPPPWQHPSD